MAINNPISQNQNELTLYIETQHLPPSKSISKFGHFAYAQILRNQPFVAGSAYYMVITMK